MAESPVSKSTCPSCLLQLFGGIPPILAFLTTSPCFAEESGLIALSLSITPLIDRCVTAATTYLDHDLCRDLELLPALYSGNTSLRLYSRFLFSDCCIPYVFCGTHFVFSAASHCAPHSACRTGRYVHRLQKQSSFLYICYCTSRGVVALVIAVNEMDGVPLWRIKNHRTGRSLLYTIDMCTGKPKA